MGVYCLPKFSPPFRGLFLNLDICISAMSTVILSYIFVIFCVAVLVTPSPETS